MTFIQEAHQQWHMIHGKYAVCDLDCGAAEALEYMDEPPAQYPRPCDDCGAPVGVACVQGCPNLDGPVEECEHGLSLWLCAGPDHYPRENQM